MKLQTCSSIRALKGLKITAVAEEEYANGTENMQMLFPAPVAILTKISCPWSAGIIASSCPGLTDPKQNTLRITNGAALTAGHEVASIEQQPLSHIGL